MAVISTEDLIKAITARIGEDVSDEAITLLENLTDTLKDRDAKISNPATEDWKAKHDALDADWRKRYMDRFTKGIENLPDPTKPGNAPAEPEKEDETSFEDCFEPAE